MPIIATASDYEPLPAGRYLATLERIEEAESENGVYWKWVFSIRKSDGSEHRLFGASSTNFGPRAKARKWVAALLGRDVRAGEHIELDTLVGSTTEVVLSVLPRPDGAMRNVIDALLPLPQGTDANGAVPF